MIKTVFKKLIVFIAMLIIISAAAGSCSRHTSPGYHGPNRVRTKPHKEWKQPKSRYVKPKKKYSSTFHYINSDQAGLVFFNGLMA